MGLSVENPIQVLAGRPDQPTRSPFVQNVVAGEPVLDEKTQAGGKQLQETLQTSEWSETDPSDDGPIPPEYGGNWLWNGQ